MAWRGTKAKSNTFPVPVRTFSAHTRTLKISPFGPQCMYLFCTIRYYLHEQLNYWRSCYIYPYHYLFLPLTAFPCVLKSLRISIRLHVISRTSLVTSCIALHSFAGFVLQAQLLSWCVNRIFIINCINYNNFGQLKACHLIHSNLVPPEGQIQTFIQCPATFFEEAWNIAVQDR